MQRKFVRMLLMSAMICVASIGAMEKEQEQLFEETIIGENFSVCRWKVEGHGGFFKLAEEESSHEAPHPENFTMLSANGREVLKISPEGQLTFDKDEEQRSVIVRDASGTIMFDTGKKRDTDAASLDEEKTEVVLIGGSVTLSASLDDTSSQTTLKVIFDKRTSLRSDKNGDFKLSVLCSVWSQSQLFSVKTRGYGNKKRGQKKVRRGQGEVFLNEAPKEIQLLDNFLKFDPKKREKLLAKLSIFEFTRLLVNLDKHGCTQIFGCSHFDDAMKLLKKEVRGLLQKATSRYVFRWSAAIEWFEQIGTWPSEAQNIMEGVLKSVIRPRPKVLFGLDNVKFMHFNVAGMRVMVIYKDGKRGVIDLEAADDNKGVLFQGDDIKWMMFNSDSTRVVVLYKGGKAEIKNLEVENEKKKILFKGDNVCWIRCNSDGTRVIVGYEDYRGAVIDLGDGRLLFEGDNVKNIQFNLASARVVVYYKDYGGEVRNLEEGDKNGKVLFKENNINYMYLNEVGTRVVIMYTNDEGEVIDLGVENDNGRTLFKGNNIRWMNFNSANTRVSVTYKGGKGKVINLEGGDGNGRFLFQGDNIEWMDLSEAGTRVIVKYEDGRGEVRDLERGDENGGLLFQGVDIQGMYLSIAGTRVVVTYKDGRREIRDLGVEDDNGRVLLQGDNIEWMNFNSAYTRVAVLYKDGKGEVINLEVEDKNGRLLFEGNNIKRVDLNKAGTRGIVGYKNDRGEVIDLEDYDRGIIFTKLKPKKLLFVFLLKNFNFSSRDNLRVYRSLWKSLIFNLKYRFLWESLSSDLKQKLLKSYLSKEVEELFVKGAIAKIIGEVKKRKKIIMFASALIFFSTIIFRTTSFGQYGR